MSRLESRNLKSCLGLEAMMSRLGLEAMMSRLGLGRFGPRCSSDALDKTYFFQLLEKANLFWVITRESYRLKYRSGSGSRNFFL